MIDFVIIYYKEVAESNGLINGKESNGLINGNNVYFIHYISPGMRENKWITIRLDIKSTMIDKSVYKSILSVEAFHYYIDNISGYSEIRNVKIENAF